MKPVLRSLIIITYLVFCCFSSLAQEKDSILNLLDGYIKKDTIRGQYLIEASNYLTYSKPKVAIEYIDEAIKIAKDKKWKKGTASALNQKGSIYYTMANNLKALDLFLEALSISENINDEKLTINLYNNVANIYADMKDFDKALANYNNCLNISIELKDTINQIRAYNNIGNVYSETNRVNTSINYFDKALLYAKQVNNIFFVAAIINNKGLAYKRKKDYNNSLKHYKEALQISREINNKYIEASALNSLGKVLVLQNKFNQAKIYAKNALAVSKNIDAVEWQADSWLVLNQVYENDQNHKKSLLAFKNYIKLRDSVATEEKKAELTKKDMQYQIDKQDTLSKAEIKRQSLIKNSAIGAGSSLLLFSIVGYFLYKRKRDAEAQKNIAEFKTKIAETELKALRSQMNPHFIFNSLNSISNYLANNDIKKADEYLLKFSILTRSILENSEKKWISLKDDLELLKMYIDIESLRLKNKLNHIVSINNNIDLENTLIPPLILQPFIENSIWHGVSQIEAEGIIKIEINSNNKTLICAVEDNGIGREKATRNLNKTSSMGIKITSQRIDLINKTKKANETIKYTDKEKGLRVEVTLPLKLKF
ncbi:tetratricopeptide repeat protein [Cellulophaga lytica]|uniref:tetratricopeptide repeat-containing sensor histidine kinase n=1 Tax=Cellulophaga lytica TaxID=979 RepID=UPI0032E3ECB2